MKNPKTGKPKNIWLGFHKKDRLERIAILKENNIINPEFSDILENNVNLPCDTAGQMTENNIGTLYSILLTIKYGAIPRGRAKVPILFSVI